MLSHLHEATAKVIWLVGFIAIEWLLLWQLYKRRIFLRV